MMSACCQSRNERLTRLSQMIINDQLTSKLDSIATIYINGRFYFNVFRRYNSPYNIVIEDINGDIYLHQDHTIRTSLKTVLCLNDYDSGNMYTTNALSFKHNGPVPSMDVDIADMRWSEVQGKYNAVSVDFTGIWHEYTNTSLPTPCELAPSAANNGSEEFYIKSEAPSTPKDQMIPPPICPAAPERPNYTNDEINAANTLLSLCIPHIISPFEVRMCDGPTLSMRFADIQNRNSEPLSGKKRYRVPVCYCEMDDDDDDEEMSDESDTEKSGGSYGDDENSDENSDESSVDENNYTVLRNGTMIPKSNT
jgi:hypothetical protein